MCFRSAGELRLAVSQSPRGPEAHPREEGTETGGPCWVDLECQDSHHTAGERKHLYKTTAAGVSCERAVWDT